MPTNISVKSVTPILVVESIEPCLAFWVERLGFALATAVPDASPYVFAIVAKDGTEIMLQTRAAVREDMPGVEETIRAAVVYISVEALEPVIAALGDAPVAVARRKTFYGADEIFVRDPAGNVIGFAAPA